jgi:hypothetical protein
MSSKKKHGHGTRSSTSGGGDAAASATQAAASAGLAQESGPPSAITVNELAAQVQALAASVAQLVANSRSPAPSETGKGAASGVGGETPPSAATSTPALSRKQKKKIRQRAKAKATAPGADLLSAIGEALGEDVAPVRGRGGQGERQPSFAFPPSSDSEESGEEKAYGAGAFELSESARDEVWMSEKERAFLREVRRRRRGYRGRDVRRKFLWSAGILEMVRSSSPTCTGFVRGHFWKSSRTRKEAGAIARAVDLLLDEGVSPAVSRGLNHLLCRLAAIERADRTGDWDMVESITSTDPNLGILPDAMLDGIARHQARAKKLKSLGTGGD